jgi:hypothetical protein
MGSHPPAVVQDPPILPQVRDMANPGGSYRMIRGWSWSFYDMSQRCCDRDGGCMDIGIRVAISEAGWR